MNDISWSWCSIPKKITITLHGLTIFTWKKDDWKCRKSLLLIFTIKVNMSFKQGLNHGLILNKVHRVIKS